MCAHDVGWVDTTDDCITKGILRYRRASDTANVDLQSEVSTHMKVHYVNILCTLPLSKQDSNSALMLAV